MKVADAKRENVKFSEVPDGNDKVTELGVLCAWKMVLILDMGFVSPYVR